MRGGREAILKAAIGVFARKGYAAASTREICQAAGITKPVLYYHFKSKEHLYQELMIDSFGHFRKTLLRSSQARGTLRERLVRVVHSDFKATREDPARIQFIFRMIFSPEEQHPFFNYVEEMDRQRRVLADVFREGIDTGEARGNPHELAGALIGMQLLAILENILAGRPSLTRRSAEKYVDLMLQGCTPRQ